MISSPTLQYANALHFADNSTTPQVAESGRGITWRRVGRLLATFVLVLPVLPVVILGVLVSWVLIDPALEPSRN